MATELDPCSRFVALWKLRFGEDITYEFAKTRLDQMLIIHQPDPQQRGSAHVESANAADRPQTRL